MRRLRFRYSQQTHLSITEVPGSDVGLLRIHVLANGKEQTDVGPSHIGRICAVLQMPQETRSRPGQHVTLLNINSLTNKSHPIYIN